MTPRPELISVTIASAFGFGMLLALLGSIKLALAKRLNIDEARVGGLLSVFFLALMPMMLLSGILIDALGVQWVVLLGSVVLAVAVFSLSLSRSYTHCLVAVLLAGAAGPCLSAGSSVLMPRAFFPDNPAASANLGNVFFGLGALVTPALADLLIRLLGFRRAVGLLAVVFLAPAVAVGLTARDAFALAPGSAQGSLVEVLSSPTLWLAALVFFLYCPLEGALGTWATTFLTDLGYREGQAALLLSGFWLTFLIGRLLAAVLQYRHILPVGSEPWVISGLALVAAMAVGNLAGVARHRNAGLGLLLLGLLLGPIFPTLVGLLFDHFAERSWGTAFGAMFALGATGNLLLPPLIGVYARRSTVQRSLRIPMILALLLALVSLAVGLLP
jgi:fucose permease